jgi:predicted phosphoribosyltransferase
MQAAIDQARLGLLKSSKTLDDIDGTFRDRAHAGRCLLDMGLLAREVNPQLVAFGPGGMVVAREMCRVSREPVAFAEVAELAPPWLGGPVFGAAAFDGSVVVDHELKDLCSVTREEFHRLVEQAYEVVARLVERRRGEMGFPDLRGRTAVVVDDGLSAPFAARAAIAAVRNAGAHRVVFALPVGYRRTMLGLCSVADLVFCASLRSPGRELSAAYAPAQHLPCLASKARKVSTLAC